MNQGGYLLLSTVAFFLTGVGLYVADKKLTVALRRLVHDWTSPEGEPFPAEKSKGLIYGQKAQQRFLVAGAISIVQTILSVRGLAYNPLYELMTLLIEAPIMVLGTYLGDRVSRLFDRAQPVFDAIDRIDAGESSAGEEAKELLRDITGRSEEKAPKSEEKKSKSEPSPAAAPPEAASEPPPAASPAPPPDEPAEDPRQLMKKYTEG